MIQKMIRIAKRDYNNLLIPSKEHSTFESTKYDYKYVYWNHRITIKKKWFIERIFCYLRNNIFFYKDYNRRIDEANYCVYYYDLNCNIFNYRLIVENIIKDKKSKIFVPNILELCKV